MEKYKVEYYPKDKDYSHLKSTIISAVDQADYRRKIKKLEEKNYIFSIQLMNVF